MADQPVVLESAEGAVITDPDGNRFLDMVAGFGSLNLGHSHPALVAAVQAQVTSGQQAMSMASTVRTALVERVARLLGDDRKVILAASGSEAVEVALKMVRRATGKQGVVAFSGGFHGRTMGALTLMGKRTQRAGLGALTAGAVHLPYPDPFRSPFGTDAQHVVDTTLALLDQQLGDPASGWMDVGAVIIEPVQGNGGMIQAPPGFMAGLAEVCRRHDVLLIADEVMSGFHRTGRLFAFQHDAGVDPDIVVMGKSLSAGLPLSACVVKPAVADASPANTESSTYAGNLVSCASASAAMDVYDSADFSRIASELGTHFVSALEDAVGDLPCVGEIRGAGLMVAVELVADEATRAPLPAARQVSDAAVRSGLLVYPGGHHGNVVAFLPPLISTPAQLDSAAGIVRDVLGALG
jgi:4-aminobutyrate aminotransferase-like enzyme